jgi:hypothetical protein
MVREFAELLGWTASWDNNGIYGEVTSPSGGKYHVDLRGAKYGGDNSLHYRYQVKHFYVNAPGTLQEFADAVAASGWEEHEKLDNEAAEQVTAEFRAKVDEIADILGWRGSVVVSEGTIDASLQNGYRRIHWRCTEWDKTAKERWEIRTHLGYGLSITVAASRTAKAIAGDIQRRLLPDYEAAVAEQADGDHSAALREATCRQLQAVVDESGIAFNGKNFAVGGLQGELDVTSSGAMVWLRSDYLDVNELTELLEALQSFA